MQHIFLCGAPRESTQFIDETIGVFNSTERIMPRMLLLIPCVQIKSLLVLGPREGTRCCGHLSERSTVEDTCSNRSVNGTCSSVYWEAFSSLSSTFSHLPSLHFTAFNCLIDPHADKRQLTAQIYMCGWPYMWKAIELTKWICRGFLWGKGILQEDKDRRRLHL